MEATVLTKVVLPIALAMIMLGMGLSLRLDDFARVLRKPKAFAIGVFCQMLLLPAIGFGIAYAVDLPPALAVGLIVIALCPGGTTSNMYTYLARGDVALSISLTAVVSMITPFTIPIVAGVAMTSFLGEAQVLELPLLKTIATLLVITVIPVAIGMFVNKKATRFARRSEGTVKVLSLVFLAAIIAGIVRQNWTELPGFFAQVGVAALTLNVVAMLAGFGTARVLRLGRAQSITIGIEVGLQNGTTALFVTSTLLANPLMSITPAVYSLIMFGTGALFGIAVNMPFVARERQAAGTRATA